VVVVRYAGRKCIDDADIGHINVFLKQLNMKNMLWPQLQNTNVQMISLPGGSTNDFIAWRKQPGGLIGMWMFGAETKDKEKIWRKTPTFTCF